MIDAAEWQNSRLSQKRVSRAQGTDILIGEGNVIQPGGARRQFGQILGSCNGDPVMFIVVREKYKAARVEDDLGSQDEAIPFHHGIEVRLRAQHDVSEFTR